MTSNPWRTRAGWVLLVVADIGSSLARQYITETHADLGADARAGAASREYTQGLREPMKVQRYDLSATPRLHGAYERLAEGARLCYPVSREEFVRGATYRGPWGRSDLQPETIIAVERAGEIVAFPQLGEAPPQDGGRPCGVVRFFVYPRGERELGDAVLLP